MANGFRTLILLAALVALVGCTRQDGKHGTPAAGATPSSPSLTQPVGPGAVPTQPAQGASFFLEVLSPRDGDTVTTPEVLVAGTSTPGAVVTVNDDILIVGDDGRFQSTVLLEEGPNMIEVVASNELGDEKSVELGIDYRP